MLQLTLCYNLNRFPLVSACTKLSFDKIKAKIVVFDARNEEFVNKMNGKVKAA